jgi:hypothetical protein
MPNVGANVAKIFLAFAVSTTCMSTAAQRPGYVYGEGAAPCRDYLNDRQLKNRDGMYADWLAGYVTAYNLFSAYPQVEVPNAASGFQPTVLAYLDKFCRDNPLGYVVQGADALIGQLGGRKPPLPKLH